MRFPLLPAVAVSVLLAAACTAAKAESVKVSVSGSYGSMPAITVGPGAPPITLRVTTLHKGSGPVVRAGQLVVADYQGEIWSTGRVFASSWEKFGAAAFDIGVHQVIAGWDRGLVGQTVGSRVLLIVPPSFGYGPGGQTQLSIGAADTLVYVVDILAVHTTTETASGTAVSPGGGPLPLVTDSGAGSVPVVTMPATLSEHLAVRTLIEGTGAAVRPGQLVVANYLAYAVRGQQRRLVGSSYASGSPQGFRLGKIVKGLSAGLVDKTIGSRVLLVIPPADGYGARGSAALRVTSKDVLVYVMDILAAY